MKHLLSILLLSGALLANEIKYKSDEAFSIDTEVYQCNLWIETSGKILLEMSEAENEENNEKVINLYSQFTYAADSAIQECMYVDDDTTQLLEEISYDVYLYIEENYNN